MVKTNKQKFNEKYKQPLNQPNSKKDITKLTGIPRSEERRVGKECRSRW
mgnify:CR=1 FL=1